MIFADESVYDKVDIDDSLSISDAIAKVNGSAAFTVSNDTKGYSFSVILDVSERLKGVLQDGGLLNHTKKQG